MKSFAALTFLLALASAAPAPETSPVESGSLAKRDTEIIYLANCRRVVSCCEPEKHTSQIFYYGASADSQNGNPPAANDQCVVDGSNYTWWEQDGKGCSFPTGVSFTTHIDSNAQSWPLYSWSGWGTNGYKNFNCYRDNGRQLFTVSGPEWANICNSVYYCVPQ